MKLLRFGCVALAAALFSTHALAGSHLVATLRDTTPPGTRDRVLVTLTVRNEGDEPVHIFRPVTPFMKSGDGLGNDVFEVHNVLRKRAVYIGETAYLGPPKLRMFTLLKPGEFLEREVDLTDQYDFENGGTFTIQHILRQWNAPDESVSTEEERASFLPGDEREVESNVITVQAPAHRFAAVRPTSAMCESDQYTIARSAWTKARLVINDAEVFTQNLSRNTTHPRYRRWFGDASLVHAADDIDTPNKRFQDHVTQLVDATYSRLVFGTFAPLCDACAAWEPDVAARAVTGSYYEFTLCPHFFKLLEAGSSPSRMGTLIHEYSHFTGDGRGPAAHDYLYGYLPVQALAKSDPWKAIRNADNYELYIVDTTPYDAVDPSPEHHTDGEANE
jgi:peptidyl-Lys metalloendopeptidase